jgi:hypothetical protein
MSRNVRVAGSLHEGGDIGVGRFALFTACSTAFLIFVSFLSIGSTLGFALVRRFRRLVTALGFPQRREASWQ